MFPMSSFRFGAREQILDIDDLLVYPIQRTDTLGVVWRSISSVSSGCTIINI